MQSWKAEEAQLIIQVRRKGLERKNGCSASPMHRGCERRRKIEVNLRKRFWKLRLRARGREMSTWRKSKTLVGGPRRLLSLPYIDQNAVYAEATNLVPSSPGVSTEIDV